MGLNLNKSKTNHFIVQRIARNDVYYFVEFDDESNTARWSSRIDLASIFKSEQGVVDFCEVYLEDRPYEIVRLR